MANDPGLASDTCIYMESVTGDGGVHNANVWWLSPDIILNGPVSGPDKADPGQNNPVQIRFHRKPDSSNCMFTGAEALNVELYAGNPSIAMTPNNSSSTALIQVIGSPVPLEGASGIQIINWTPPQGVPASDPQSAGHKCLIARSYPDNLTPSPTKFFAPDDPHVAQRNICIVPCNAPGAAKRPGPCAFDITTLNLNAEQAETVTVRAEVDMRPSRFVRDTVLRDLERLPYFKRLATRPPNAFRFELREFPDAEIDDRSRLGCLGILLGGKRQFQAKIKLQPGQLIRPPFVADLQGASFGDAYIFHLTQFGQDHQPQGGLTLVMVA
jgi:hypothetical protein